jgi:dinuclear metal center YbgI/SA1388 family protein
VNLNAEPLSVARVIEWLQALAPLDVAEEWDNVGLLWGDASWNVERAMTCLTLTADVALEALERGAGLIVTHHPILFRPVQRITADTAEGQSLLQLAQHRVAVYCMHTAYDNAAGGINRQLADALELQEIAALRPCSGQSEWDPRIGSGRCGRLASAQPLSAVVLKVAAKLELPATDIVGDDDQAIERVAIACGSAAEYLRDAARQNCQLLITGEARFHACLEARERGVALLLIGHYASERPAMERLAAQIGRQFPGLNVWPSEREKDPLKRGS